MIKSLIEFFELQEIKLQPLPPLKKVLSSQSMGIRNKYDRPVAIQNIGENQTIEV